MLQGPSPTFALVKRELLASLRSWKALALLLLLFAPLYLKAWGILQRLSHGNLYDAVLIRGLFDTLSSLLLLTAMTVVPIAAATTVDRDRASGTLEMLFVTHITRGQILLAQAGAILLVFAIVAVALLPFLGVTYFFVGVEVSALLHAAFVVSFTATACAALGILASVTAANPGTAVGTALVLVVFFEWILPMVFAWYEGGTGGNIAPPVARFKPGAALEAAELSALAQFGLYQAAITACAFTCALAWFRGFRPFAFLAPLGRACFPPRPPRADGIMEKYKNPILAWEAARHPCFGRKNWLIFGLLTLFCTGYVWYFAWPPRMLFEALVPLKFFMLLLLLPTVVAIRVIPDLQPDKIDGLTASLITPREFALGKSLALLQSLWPYVLAPFVATIIFTTLIMPNTGTLGTLPDVFLYDLLALPFHAIAITMICLAGVCRAPRTIISALLASCASLFLTLVLLLPVLLIPVVIFGMAVTELLEYYEVPYPEVIVTVLMNLLVSLACARMAFEHVVAHLVHLWDGSPSPGERTNMKVPPARV